MNCSKCGIVLPEDAKFCGNCGTIQEPLEEAVSVQEAPAPVYQAVPAPVPVSACQAQPMPAYPAQPSYQTLPAYPQPAAETAPARGSRYAPVSALGYFAYLFVFGIPVLGLVMAFVWARDKVGSINRQNLAKLVLVLKILAIILLIALIVFFAVFGDDIARFAEELMEEAQANGYVPYGGFGFVAPDAGSDAYYYQ